MTDVVSLPINRGNADAIKLETGGADYNGWKD